MSTRKSVAALVAAMALGVIATHLLTTRRDRVEHPVEYQSVDVLEANIREYMRGIK